MHEDLKEPTPSKPMNIGFAVISIEVSTGFEHGEPIHRIHHNGKAKIVELGRKKDKGRALF